MYLSYDSVFWLHAAAKAGDLQAIQELIETWDLEPTMKDNQGYQPIHIAAMYGHTHIVAYFVEVKKISPEATVGPKKVTPFVLAVAKQKWTVAKWLIIHSTENQYPQEWKLLAESNKLKKSDIYAWVHSRFNSSELTGDDASNSQTDPSEQDVAALIATTALVGAVGVVCATLFAPLLLLAAVGTTTEDLHTPLTDEGNEKLEDNSSTPPDDLSEK